MGVGVLRGGAVLVGRGASGAVASLVGSLGAGVVGTFGCAINLGFGSGFANWGGGALGGG